MTFIGNHSLIDNGEVVASLVPAAYSGAQNGTGVDLRHAQNVTLAILLGAYTSGQADIVFQASEDNSNWVAVPAGDLKGRIGTTNHLNAAGTTVEVADNSRDGQILLIEFYGQPNQRYIRAVASGTYSVLFGVAVIKTGMQYVGKNPMDTAKWDAPNVG